MIQLPPGWALHPQNPAYAYQLADPNNVQPVSVFAPAAAPAPAPAYAPPAAAPAQQYAAPYNEFSDDPLANYQSPDTEEVLGAKEAEERNARGWGTKGVEQWLDFPKKSKEMAVGEELYLNVRFLANLKNPAEYMVIEKRHRVFAENIPSDVAGNRQVMYIPCPSQPSLGNKPCAICDAIARVSLEGDAKAQKHVENMDAQLRFVYQVINNDDPQSHWTEDPSKPGGWSIRPKLIGIGKRLDGDLRAMRRRIGDFCHPYHGYNMRLSKLKEGKESMHVKYGAAETSQEPTAIRDDLMVVQVNAYDLHHEVIERFALKDEVIQQIGDTIIRKQLGAHAVHGGSPGLPPGGPWLPHPQQPGWEYQPSTSQMRPSAQAAPPPPPAAMPPGPPQTQTAAAPAYAGTVTNALPPGPPQMAAPVGPPPAMLPPVQTAPVQHRQNFAPPMQVQLPPAAAPGLVNGAPPPIPAGHGQPPPQGPPGYQGGPPPGMAPPTHMQPAGAAGAPGQVPGMGLAPPPAPPPAAQSPAQFEQAAQGSLGLPPTPVYNDDEIPF